MTVTNAENQAVGLKEKIETFFVKSRTTIKGGFCPTKDLMATTTDKWSLFVLFNLGYSKTMRFSELKGKIKRISSRMLTVTLKKLEKNGLIERKVFAEVPPRVEYNLTEFGEALSERLIDLNDWFFMEYLKTLDEK